MTQEKANPFSTEVIEAICRHMNQDHQEDSLLICRTAGGVPDVSRASVRSVDGDGVDFAAVVDGEGRMVRVLWSRPITERSEVRAELTRLTLEARERSRWSAPAEPSHPEGSGGGHAG